MTDKEDTPPITRDRQGIDGCLLLWAINLVLLFPIAVYGLWVVPVLAVREHPSGLPIAALLYGVLFCLFGLFAATRFFQRHSSARNLMIALLTANLGFWLINATVWDFVISDLPGSDYAVEDFLIYQFVGSLVACFIWIPYFLISKRVKRTFVL
jgi:hypothetical protein